MANMTIEEKFDAVTSFCDKYEEDIENAALNSILWAIGTLDTAWSNTMISQDENGNLFSGDGALEAARNQIIDVMYYLCDKYATEREVLG